MKRIKKTKEKRTVKGCLAGCLKWFVICIAVLFGIGMFMDTEPPFITAEDQIAEYGTKIYYSQFVVAEDNESEEIDLEILTTDIWGLTINNEERFLICDKAGIYEIEIAATDESDNQATEIVQINVTDTQQPKILEIQDDYAIGYNESVDLFSNLDGIRIQIDEPSDYEISFVDLNDVESIENMESDENNLAISNGDVSSSELYIEGDIEDEIKILKVGTYIVEFLVEDTYGNSTTDFVTIEVQDRTAPVLECKLELFELADSATRNDYRRQISAFDEIDGNLSAIMEIDDSKVEYGRIGDYEIYVTAIDKSGNVATKSYPVSIKDKTAPKLTLNKTTFSLTAGDDAPDYRSLIFAEDGIDGDVTSLITVDDSAVNYDKAGSYKVKFTVSDESGNTVTKQATVKVEKVPTKSNISSGDIASTGHEVLITKTGECYHAQKCGRGTYYWVSLETAKARGLRPCKKCY